METKKAILFAAPSSVLEPQPCYNDFYVGLEKLVNNLIEMERLMGATDVILAVNCRVRDRIESMIRRDFHFIENFTGGNIEPWQTMTPGYRKEETPYDLELMIIGLASQIRQLQANDISFTCLGYAEKYDSSRIREREMILRGLNIPYNIFIPGAQPFVGNNNIISSPRPYIIGVNDAMEKCQKQYIKGSRLGKK